MDCWTSAEATCHRVSFSSLVLKLQVKESEGLLHNFLTIRYRKFSSSSHFLLPQSSHLLDFCKYFLSKIPQCLKKRGEILSRSLVRVANTICLAHKCTYRSVNVFFSSTVCSKVAVSSVRASQSLLFIGARMSPEKISQWITV